MYVVKIRQSLGIFFNFKFPSCKGLLEAPHDAGPFKEHPAYSFPMMTSLRLISTTKGLSAVLINLCDPTYTLLVIPIHLGFPV